MKEFSDFYDKLSDTKKFKCKKSQKKKKTLNEEEDIYSPFG